MDSWILVLTQLREIVALQYMAVLLAKLLKCRDTTLYEGMDSIAGKITEV
jgi:hypothetical protein